MPRSNPASRFALRGSLLLILLLTVWWFWLSGPLLEGLRLAAQTPLRMLPGSVPSYISLTERGDWVFHVPAFGDTARAAGDVKVRAIQLAAARSKLILFTLPFPIYFAVVLAGPWSRKWWRVLVAGPLLLIALAVPAVLLLALSLLNDNLHLLTNRAASWLLNYAQYINDTAAPYAAPLFIALWMHEELRRSIFTPRSILKTQA